MQSRIRGSRVLCALLLAAGIALLLSACGSGSGDATKLLEQTFGRAHPVGSGNLSINLGAYPSGSRTLTQPVTVSIGGPIQSLGKGRLPAFDLSFAFSGFGKAGAAGVVSTGAKAYVTLRGVSYQLPAAAFQQAASSFAQAAASSGAGASSPGTLSQLGINPLRWLVSPKVIGTERVGGVETTHIHATVNVAALLGDFNTFLQKASSLGASGTPKGISEATRSRIASETKQPGFDVWTGTADKTLRKVAISFSVPVSGQTSTALGGLRAVRVGLTVQIAGLGVPQAIQAPARTRPFGELAAKARAFIHGLQNISGTSGK